MLLDPSTWSVANRIDEALAALPPSLARHASAETHACVIELRTDPHPTVREAAAELSQLRAALDDALQETLGLRAAVAGTHPLVTSEQVAVSSSSRYRQVSSSMRALTHREPTMAQHVHVAVPDARDGCPDPGRPAQRPPPAARPVGQLAVLARRGLGLRLDPDPDLLDVPPRRHPATVRQLLRVRRGRRPAAGVGRRSRNPASCGGTPACGRSSGRSRCGSWTPSRASRTPPPSPPWSTASRASGPPGSVRPTPDPRCWPRTGSSRRATAWRAQIIDARTLRKRSLRGALTELLGRCELIASSLGCADELAAATALGDDPGAARQRRLAARDGVAALPAWLADEFTAVDRVAAVT